MGNFVGLKIHKVYFPKILNDKCECSTYNQRFCSEGIPLEFSKSKLIFLTLIFKN
jgi:hypothetical protein